MKITLLVLVVVVAALVVVDEVSGHQWRHGRHHDNSSSSDSDSSSHEARERHGGRGGRHHDNSSSSDSDSSSHEARERKHHQFSWLYPLNENTSLPFSAFVKNGSDFAVIKSGDRPLRRENISSAFITYDFTNTSKLVIISPLGPFPCFIINTLLTFIEVKDKLTAVNGTTVTSLPNVSLNASVPLTEEELNTLAVSNPSARRICRFRPIVRTSAPEAGAEVSNTTIVINIIGLESVYGITVPRPEHPPTDGKGRHGGPGGHHGGRGGHGRPGGPGGPGGRRH